MIVGESEVKKWTDKWSMVNQLKIAHINMFMGERFVKRKNENQRLNEGLSNKWKSVIRKIKSNNTYFISIKLTTKGNVCSEHFNQNK